MRSGLSWTWLWPLRAHTVEGSDLPRHYPGSSRTVAPLPTGGSPDAHRMLRSKVLLASIVYLSFVTAAAERVGPFHWTVVPESEVI